MIKCFQKIAIVISFVAAIFHFGRSSGRKSEKAENIANMIKINKQIKKRQDERGNDSIATVKHRMSSFIRK